MNTIWYLWAVNNDPMTNKYLAQVVGAETEFDTANMRKGVVCADGKKRDLYICPNGYTDVKRAKEAIPEFNLKVWTFKEDTEDVIARFVLQEQSVRKKAKHKRSALMSRLHKAKKTPKPPRRVPF